MTVKELIKELERLNPDADVFVTVNDMPYSEFEIYWSDGHDKFATAKEVHVYLNKNVDEEILSEN